MKIKVEQWNIHLPIYCYLLLLQFLIIKDGLRIIIYFIFKKEWNFQVL